MVCRGVYYRGPWSPICSDHLFHTVSRSLPRINSHKRAYNHTPMQICFTHRILSHTHYFPDPTHTLSLMPPISGGGVIVPRWAPVTPSLSILLLRWTERQSLSLQRFKTFDSLFLEVNKHQFHSVGSGATASKDHVRIKSAVSGMQLPALSKGGDGGGGFKKHKWVTTSYNSRPTLISRQPNKALNSQFRHMRYSPCPLCTKYK